jgi:hypothetical protein
MSGESCAINKGLMLENVHACKALMHAILKACSHVWKDQCVNRRCGDSCAM